MTKEQQGQGCAVYKGFVDAMKKEGAFIARNRLSASSNATTLRQADGKLQVPDGPFADSKEQLGGYFLIEAKNLDEAIAWGSRCPATGHGAVEVRPIVEMPAAQQVGPKLTRPALRLQIPATMRAVEQARIERTTKCEN